MLFRNGTRVVALRLTNNVTAHGLRPRSEQKSLGTPFFLPTRKMVTRMIKNVKTISFSHLRFFARNYASGKLSLERVNNSTTILYYNLKLDLNKGNPNN